MPQQPNRIPTSPRRVRVRIPAADHGLTGEMGEDIFDLLLQTETRNCSPNLAAPNGNRSRSRARAVCPRRTVAAVSLTGIQSLDRSINLSYRAKLQPNPSR